MTPFEISIMLHYATSSNDFRDGDFSAPILPGTLQKLAAEELLEGSCFGPGDPHFHITPRGAAYVDHLCAMPLPVCKWVLP